MKLLDKIKRLLRKRGYILKPLIVKKTKFAKPGQCRVIEPYDLEVSRKEEAEEKARESGLPHND